jgi:hypothetical protein
MQGSSTAVTSLSQHTQHSSSYQPLLLAVVSALGSAGVGSSAQHVSLSAASAVCPACSVLNVTDLRVSLLRAGKAQLAAA